MGTRNRRTGNAWELTCKRKLEPIFPFLVSARSESRNRDNQKVDLMNADEYKNGRCPYNIQCKSLCSTSNYRRIMEVMPTDIGVNVILHNQTKKKGSRFITVGNYAILDSQEFWKIKNKIKGNLQADLYVVHKSQDRSVGYHGILSKLKGNGKFNVVIHTRKANDEGYAILKLKDFYSILNKHIKPLEHEQ